jgi:hypothetical protein
MNENDEKVNENERQQKQGSSSHVKFGILKCKKISLLIVSLMLMHEKETTSLHICLQNVSCRYASSEKLHVIMSWLLSFRVSI